MSHKLVSQFTVSNPLYFHHVKVAFKTILLGAHFARIPAGDEHVVGVHPVFAFIGPNLAECSSLLNFEL